MTIEEIKELLRLFNDSGVGELELQRGDNRLRIRRAGMSQDSVVEMSGAPIAAAPPQNPAGLTGTTTAAHVKKAEEAGGLLVKSPIVGTYYEAPGPGAPPFVRIGDTVEPGQVLCIIESMKLMNEIEAEVAGVVASKLVENGQPVEYGEALFAIRPR